MVMQAFAEVAAEIVPNFEGVVFEMFASMNYFGLVLQFGVSLVYSTTLNEWAAFTFKGLGIGVPGGIPIGGSVMMGAGVFFWEGEGRFSWEDYSGTFNSFAATVCGIGGEYFQSEGGNIKGFMLLVGVGTEIWTLSWVSCDYELKTRALAPWQRYPPYPSNPYERVGGR